MSRRFFWIIGGGLLQIPLIEEVKKLGLDTLVTDGSATCVCASQASRFEALDIFDIDGHVAFADRLINEGHEIVAVLAAGIDAPETMARLAEHLSLPGVSSEIAHVVNHKDVFRKKMAELGLPIPEFRVISDVDDLPAAVESLGYPLIVKNTCSSGSRGTKFFFVPDLAGVTEMVREAMAVSRSRKALLESVWVGTEHTVETLFDVNGNFHRCFITDRLFDQSEGYPLETGLIHPSQLSHEAQEEMYLVAEQVARQMGITIGAAKYDMIYTQDGPRIIEMTVRLSGGFDCQYVVPAATGKNVLKAAALTALGQPFDPSLLEDHRHRVVISESLWPKPGIFKELRGIEDAKKLPGFEHLFIRYQPGDEITPYIDCTKRFCFIIVSGATLDEARENFVRIEMALQVIVE